MSVKLPTASATIDGIILNTAQTLAGAKQLNLPDATSFIIDRVVAANSTSNPALLVQRNGGAVAATIGYDDLNTRMYFGTTTSHPLDFRTNNTKVGFVDATGLWTFGTSNTNLNILTINGQLTVDASGTTGNDLNFTIKAGATGRPLVKLVQNATTKAFFATSAGASGHILTGDTAGQSTVAGVSDLLFSGDGATNHGQVLTTGSWTLGNAAGGSPTHTFYANGNRNVKVAPGGGANNARIGMVVDNNSGNGFAIALGTTSGALGMAYGGGTFNFWNATSANVADATLMGLGTTGTVVGTIDTGGAWTFGLSGAGTGNNAHTINNMTATASSAVFSVNKGTNSTATSNIFVAFFMNNGGTGSGLITANGASAAGFTSSSDSRLKQNIVNLDSQLDNIMALRPVEFDYIAGGHNIGFIAQEMQTVFPDVVGENVDGYLTVTAWDKTSARLVKAIQELKQQFDAYVAAHP